MHSCAVLLIILRARNNVCQMEVPSLIWLQESRIRVRERSSKHCKVDDVS